MKKKYYIIGLLVLAAIVLFYFLLHEPKPQDSHADDYTRVLADNKAFQLREDSILHRADSLEIDGRAKDSVIAALKSEKKATQKQADSYAATANRLSKEVKELRQGDTSEFARKCDSLAEAAINFKFLYEQYKDNSDSLAAQMERQAGDYASALMEQKRLYNQLKQMYDGLQLISEKVYKDYQAAQKTVRRERLKTKIAALLALIGGAAAVLK